VVGVTQATGQQLAATSGLVLRIKTETLRGIATTYNVLAESKGGDAGNVVMAGAHLDSVNAGPGINDNGSGSAALLEVANQMKKVNPRNKVRFAWWGAEESNLVGSTYYVNNLPAEELDKIALYLNFDMIGSPNHGFFIYDGDDSDLVGAGPGPSGSAQIEDTFEAYFAMKGITPQGTDFSGRSDYGPFIAAGIPSGGLFTGAEGIKTAEQAALWGGTAGIAYDPCYHQACDTYANNNNVALDVNSDAVAYAVLKYAMNTSDVNAVRGKGNFKVPEGYSETHTHEVTE
jgi:aminopeptidase Y